MRTDMDIFEIGRYGQAEATVSSETSSRAAMHAMCD